MRGLRAEELAYLRVQAVQGEIYEGLYDTRNAHHRSGQVRELNPGYGDDDSTSRRFSLVEVD